MGREVKRVLLLVVGVLLVLFFFVFKSWQRVFAVGSLAFSGLLLLGGMSLLGDGVEFRQHRHRAVVSGPGLGLQYRCSTRCGTATRRGK